MSDQLKHYLDNASRRAVAARDIMNDAPSQFLADVVVDLCTLVKQLVDRLPPEPETEQTSDEPNDSSTRSSTQNVLSRIARERHRQVAQEGYTHDHDDEHPAGQLAIAAGCYALHRKAVYQHSWPLSPGSDKRSRHSELRRLEIAGALIVAEMERLLRKEKKEATDQ